MSHTITGDSKRANFDYYDPKSPALYLGRIGHCARPDRDGARLLNWTGRKHISPDSRSMITTASFARYHHGLHRRKYPTLMPRTECAGCGQLGRVCPDGMTCENPPSKSRGSLIPTYPPMLPDTGGVEMANKHYPRIAAARGLGPSMRTITGQAAIWKNGMLSTGKPQPLGACTDRIISHCNFRADVTERYSAPGGL